MPGIARLAASGGRPIWSAVSYLITIELRAGRDELDKSRVLDVAERLEGQFHRSGAAQLDINDPRRKWNQLLITVPEAPRLGPVMGLIQAALRDQGLEDIARIKRRRLTAAAPAKPQP